MATYSGGLQGTGMRISIVVALKPKPTIVPRMRASCARLSNHFRDFMSDLESLAMDWSHGRTWS